MGYPASAIGNPARVLHLGLCCFHGRRTGVFYHSAAEPARPC